MRPISRITPALPTHAYQTYQVVAPPSTHWRPATCAEADCPAYHQGWKSVIDETSDLGQRQAHYIRRESGRRFAETRNEAGLTVFEFEVGQRCFAPHQVRLDRPEVYLVRAGDFRGNPTGQVRRHANAADWTEDFAEHQGRLADVIEKG
ncbi:hypothetical protein AB0I81_34800 [Nonomuraea sp. NPDC050404]|uniref:hypothetical protein n=1 Tax=Nonomuraea sp. NPDC050404 TaxID=3155783 RepID=UPI0033CD2E6E